MATCRDIITYALRIGKVIGTRAEPTAAEAEMGMVALQSLYDQWRTGGMFGRLKDVYETTDYEAGERQLVTSDGSAITFPVTIDDDSPRAPRDLALIEANNGSAQVARIYDRTGWIDLLGLTLDDAAPLADRGAYALGAALACSGGFITMFGAQIAPEAQRLSSGFIRSLAHSYGSTQDRSGADWF